jgi:hypothetical protein
MVASPVATEEQQVVETAGQVVPMGTVVKNEGPDDHKKIVDLLVPMSDNAPTVRSILTHSGRNIRLHRVCHYRQGATPGAGKIRFIENRVRQGQTLDIADIAELHLK